jgi:addiction module HigA family antidote
VIKGVYASDGLNATRSSLRLQATVKGCGKTKDVTMGQLRNPHPGEILKEEFLNEIGLSQNQLAHAIGVPGNRIHAVVNGTRDISADTDLRLCKFFGLSEGYWLRLQNAFDTLEAKRRVAAEIAKIKPYNYKVSKGVGVRRGAAVVPSEGIDLGRGPTRIQRAK